MCVCVCVKVTLCTEVILMVDTLERPRGLGGRADPDGRGEVLTVAYEPAREVYRLSACVCSIA